MDSTEDILADLDLYYLRQMAVNLKEYDLEQKIDREIKMRDGTTRLLAACRHQIQTLEAAKNLLVSNARMSAYMEELQRRRSQEHAAAAAAKGTGRRSAGHQEIKPCRGQVGLSDIRIPLMWKESDHIMNKGDYHRYSAFCLLKIGTEVYDTHLLRNIDRTMSDICFDDYIVFENIRSDFEFVLEVYAYSMDNDLTIASTPKKIKKKISNSVGRSIGKKIAQSLASNDFEGPKFDLVATATLNVEGVGNSIRSHDLRLEKKDDGGHELPLYGHFCCRLAARPVCMVQERTAGFLKLQETIGGLAKWSKVYGVVRQSKLQCWADPTDMDLREPLRSIPVTKNTTIYQQTERRQGAASPGGTGRHLVVVRSRDPATGADRQHTFSCRDQAQLDSWMKALEQQFVDTAAWQHVCTDNDLMEIRPPSPWKQSFYYGRKGSLYDETSLKGSGEESGNEDVFKITPNMLAHDRPTNNEVEQE